MTYSQSQSTYCSYRRHRAISTLILFLAHILGATSRKDTSPSINFAAIGDWGAPLDSPHQIKGQQDVANGLAYWLQHIISNNDNESITKYGGYDQSEPFILSLGDNFYPAGVKDVAEMKDRFNASFNNVYNHDIYKNIQWHATAGNVDYGDISDASIRREVGERNLELVDVTKQMNFTDTRWNFPDYFHKVVRKVEDVKVEIIMIDTMQLAGWDHTNTHIAKQGWDYINHHLSNSDANYLIVAGHFPSQLVHGLDRTLQKNDVSAYVNGHVHCQQHKIKHGINHFDSGAGMELACSHPIGYDDVDTTGGFLTFHATIDQMIVRFHNQDGKEMHSVHISPRSISAGERVSDLEKEETVAIA